MDKQQQFDEILEYYRTLNRQGDQDTTIRMLRELQELWGYLPMEAQDAAAKVMGVKHSFIAALIKRFPSLKGEDFRHKLLICTGPRCMKKGSYALCKAAEQALGITRGMTTPDGRFAFKTQNCLKQCGTSPNLMVDDDLYTNVKPEELIKILERYN